MGGKGLDPMWAGYLSMQPAQCVFWGLEVWNVTTTLNPYKTRPELGWDKKHQFGIEEPLDQRALIELG